MSLLHLWPSIHWFINTALVTIHPVGLYNPFSKTWMVSMSGCLIRISSTLVQHFALVEGANAREIADGAHGLPFAFLLYVARVGDEALCWRERLVITGSLTSRQPSSDSRLMASAPALRQTPVGPRIERERARPASLFYISVIISLLMLCLHSVSPQAPPKNPATTATHSRTCKHTHTHSPLHLTSIEWRSAGVLLNLRS